MAFHRASAALRPRIDVDFGGRQNIATTCEINAQ